MSDAQPLVAVRLVGLPLDVYQRAAEHNDELLREFALLRGDDGEHVPTRLLALIDELRVRFATFTSRQTGEMEAALARGEREIDLLYEVPVEAAPAAVHLGQLLDEADEFCRTGDLLTLAAPVEAVAFRQWFLEEFVHQVGGRAPRSWAAFLKARAGG